MPYILAPLYITVCVSRQDTSIIHGVKATYKVAHINAYLFNNSHEHASSQKTQGD
jgi:hypothetical protein